MVTLITDSNYNKIKPERTGLIEGVAPHIMTTDVMVLDGRGYQEAIGTSIRAFFGVVTDDGDGGVFMSTGRTWASVERCATSAYPGA